MLFFSQTADRIAATTKKLEKTAALAEYFRSVSVDEAATAAVFFSGRPFPAWEETTLQVGGSILWRIVSELSGKPEEELTNAYRTYGDLGAVAEVVLSEKKWSAARPGHSKIENENPANPVTEIQRTFREIAAARRPAFKAALVRNLLESVTPLEAKYIIKIMTGDLRIGLKESLVEEAIAKAFADSSGEKPAGSNLKAVQRANMLLGDIGETLRLASGGRLAEARMRLFHPIGFMLASPAESAEDALAYFQNAWVEDKYDGIRAQAHCSGDEVRFFSRTRDEITESFPELPDALGGLPHDAILDGEILAWSYTDEGESEDDSSSVVSRTSSAEQSHVAHPASCVDASLVVSRSPFANQSRGKESYVASRRSSVSHDAGELENPQAAPEERPNLAQHGSAGKTAISHASPGGTAEPRRERQIGRALPFSALQKRLGRKKVTESLIREIPVAYLIFDVLYANGELVIDRPLLERAKTLDALLANRKEIHHGDTETRRIKKGTDVQGLLDFTSTPTESQDPRAESSSPTTYDRRRTTILPTTDDQQPTTAIIRAPMFPASSPEQLDALFDAARARGNEGLMIKDPQSPYTPGRRGKSWLKLKRELATLDVVVTAVEYGHGKRIGVLSDYTFAVRDGDRLLNVGKAYSGLTDLEIAEMTKWFLDHTIEDQGFRRTVEPKIVLEVAFNNVMKSDRHASGYALRFPRIVRLRPDKLPEEIDPLDRVKEIYERQGP